MFLPYRGKGENTAHFVFVDTFNFSFFDDKPEAPEDAAAPASSPAPASSEAAPEADPFGFDDFSLEDSPHPSNTSPIEAEPEFRISPRLGLNSSGDFSGPESDVNIASRLDLNATGGSDNALDTDLPDLEFEPFLAGPNEDELHDITLAPSIEPPAQPSLSGVDEVSIPHSQAGFTSVHGTELDFAPVSSDVAEANEALAGESLDFAQIEPTTVASFPEVRASVEPAVFIASAADNPVPIPDATPIPAPPAATARLGAAKGAKFLTADDPYGELAPPRERLRVAVLGASGIGKNHARWLAKHSCDVVAFLGSSDESVELTRSHLEAHMGFSGQGFSDLGRLLSQTQPQAVSIASPSPLHFAQAMQCLEAGIHVLCEKPLVYSPNRTKRENVSGALELLKAAARRELVLATQLQYGAASPILCRLAGVSPFEVGDFAMEIETTNVKAPRDPKELWIELASHPLSVAQYIAGEGAEIIEETIQIVPARSAYTSEVSARFGVQCEGGRLLMCRAIVRWFDKIVDNREPRRRFSFNGRVVQYSGVKSPDGTYIAQYVAPDGYISHYSDPVDYLVGNFVRTCWGDDQLLLSAEQGVQNLDWLLTTAAKLPV